MADIARFRRMVAEPSSTVYSDADLEGYIERALGDYNGAAADVWLEKCSRAAEEYDEIVTSQSLVDGGFVNTITSERRATIGVNARYQYHFYNARRVVRSVGVAAVE